MEIVTWGLRWSLVHQDSEGHSGVIYPGLAQRMSVGTGILHSEKNDAWTVTGGPAHTEPVRFVQMWLVPDEDGIDPGYEQMEIDDDLLKGGLVPVASGMTGHRDQAAIRIRQKDAALYAARIVDATTVVLPDAPYVHLFVARGSVDLEGSGRLGEGGAARITVAEDEMVTASGDPNHAKSGAWTATIRRAKSGLRVCLRCRARALPELRPRYPDKPGE